MPSQDFLPIDRELLLHLHTEGGTGGLEEPLTYVMLQASHALEVPLREIARSIKRLNKAGVLETFDLDGELVVVLVDPKDRIPLTETGILSNPEAIDFTA